MNIKIKELLLMSGVFFLILFLAYALITIDLNVSPKISISKNNISYNEEIYFNFSEGEAFLNNEEYISGTLIDEEGFYTLVIVDEFDNEFITFFTLDFTSPEVEGVDDDGIYNEPVTISFNEGMALLNGEIFSNNSVYDIEGDHELEVLDEAGNYTRINFTLDFSPPEVEGIEDEGIYNEAVTITFSDGNAVLNGEPFSKGTIVSEEGEYNLTIEDVAGNITTINFTLDFTPPEVYGVENNIVYDIVTISFNDGSAVLNDIPFINGTTVYTDGFYVLVVTDIAGNETVIEFTIKDTLPPEVYGVENGGIYFNPLTIIFSEGTALLNGVPFANEGTVNEPGQYLLEVTDEVGNVTQINFVILDLTPPEVYGVEDWGVYYDPITITFNDGIATLNDKPFYNGTEVYEEGDYILVIRDQYGNQTVIRFKIIYL
jgi:hypothetical protein